jgi:hypothetical protein
MCPLRNRSVKVPMTALEYAGSMVNWVRSQSQDAPSLWSCSRIFPPFSRRHSHTRLTKASRPSSCRVFFCLRSSRSTTVWVAIPAWSRPGIQSADLPSRRARRISMSWRVLLSTWPIVRTPVTLGGGMTMEYGARPGWALPAKAPASSHAAYHFFSTSCGS